MKKIKIKMIVPYAVYKIYFYPTCIVARLRLVIQVRVFTIYTLHTKQQHIMYINVNCVLGEKTHTQMNTHANNTLGTRTGYNNIRACITVAINIVHFLQDTATHILTENDLLHKERIQDNIKSM